MIVSVTARPEREVIQLHIPGRRPCTFRTFTVIYLNQPSETKSASFPASLRNRHPNS